MYYRDSQKHLDMYLLCRLDEKLGQHKINEPRIRKYAGRLGIPDVTIDDYLTFRDFNSGARAQVDGFYSRVLDTFYKKHPLLWQRLIY